MIGLLTSNPISFYSNILVFAENKFKKQNKFAPSKNYIEATACLMLRPYSTQFRRCKLD